jgi:hypothetical protein
MKQKSWWDKPVGKWVFYLSCALSLTVIIGAGNFTMAVVEKADEGRKAKLENDSIHPVIFEIRDYLKDQKKENDQFRKDLRDDYKDFIYRDSIRDYYRYKRDRNNSR